MTIRTGRRRFLKQSALAGSGALGGALLGAAGLNLASPHIWREPLAIEPNTSLWARSQPPLNPALAQDIAVDVAVVGGGFTGLSAAYSLRRARPDWRVAVLEARGCGNGASGRNGAMVLTMTADRYLNLSADPAMDKALYELTADNVARMAALAADLGMDAELDRNGALQVCNTADDAADAQAYVRRANAAGMPVQFWDGRRVAAALGTRAYEGAFFDPGGGQIHPMKWLGVLKAAALRAGAEVYETTEVRAIEEGQEHVLHTAGGVRVRAASLVLASNAFTPNLGFMRNAVVPVREYVAATAPLSEAQLESIGWRLRAPFNDSRTEVFYLGLTREGRLHIGGGVPRYDFNNGRPAPGAAVAHEAAFKTELARIYPPLAGVEFETRWDGVVDWSLNEAPSVGRTGRFGNVFYGLGYSGHGVNLTSVFGRVIADLAVGREQAWARFPFLNARLPYSPNEPFRWLAATANLAWYGS